jgi:hypothetical protein
MRVEIVGDYVLLELIDPSLWGLFVAMRNGRKRATLIASALRRF